MESTAGCSQQCSSCDASSARCWCVECNEALCDLCVSAHRRVTVTRSHQILNQPPAGRVSTPPTKFCRHHPSEPLKLYCFTCLQLTCRDCQLTAHMNHRYQFISEALDSIRKQLDVLVRPIRTQGDTVRRSLLDMKTRLKDIADSNYILTTELQRSYNLITQHLKRRMEDILSEVKKVSESERELIVKRMERMKQLQQDQQSVTEIAERARNTNELSALQTFTDQIQSYLKNPPDKDSSPPETMSQLSVITDTLSLEAILNFGKLDIKWVPFSVTQTSNLNTPSASSSSTSTSSSSTSSSSSSTSSTSTSSTLPQTRTAQESSVSFNCPSASSKSSSNQLSPPPSSSLSIIQSSAPVTMITAPTFTPAVQHPSSLSHLKKSQTKMSVPVSTLGNLEPVGCFVPHSARPSPGTKLQLLNRPIAPRQNQSSAVILNYSQALYQVSCFTLPPVVPQFSTMHSLTSARHTQDKQQKGPFSSVSVHQQVLPSATTGNKSSSQPGVTVLPSHDPKSIHQPLTDINCPTTSSPASSSQPLTPAADCFTPLEINPHSSSLKHQQQSPVVRAVADSACDRSVQQVAVRRQEPAENEPTSTVSGDPAPAREPSAPVVSDIESAPEVTDRKAEPEPQVLETKAELVPEVSDREAQPEPEVSDREAEPEPGLEVLETKAELVPEVSDREAELEPGPKVSESKSEFDPEPEVSDGEAELEPGPKVSESESEFDPEPEVSDGKAEPEPEVSNREAELEPGPEVLETKAEPEPEASDGEAEEGSSVIGYLNYSLSQWQPRVSLYRLPVSLPRPGHPPPGFRLVLGDAEDEIFLEEMSDDSQSDNDDITEVLPSSPESPVMLMMVACSACRSPNGSIVCTACGRGYHRDCHIPPVGPHIRSEWLCSLCQDLSDPSDPFSCDRPQRLQSYGLSLLDQRRCESLLLQLMVEGYPQFSKSQVMLVSKRLTCGSPSYQTPAEFLSDIFSLFKDTSQDDDVLNKLQDRLRQQWMRSLKLLPSVSSNTDGVRGVFSSNMSDTREVTEGGKGSKVTTEKEAISSESKLRETRKRLKDFLDLMETSRSKRTKTDDS